MMRFRFVVAVVAAGTLVGGAALSDVSGAAASSGAANAARSATVGKVHTLTTGPASVLDTVHPLTGSPNYLVYWQRTLQTAQLVSPVAPTQRPSLQALSKAGKITNLGPFPSPALSGWSMSGDTMTATRGNEVFVYSASSGAHHVVTLVTGTHYISAAPGGFLYTGSDELSRHNASGPDTSLGDPFGAGVGIGLGTSSAAGVVLTGNRPPVYVPFADPTHPVTLSDLGADGDGGATSCDAVNAIAAACVNPFFPSVTYVPLDGSQATDDPGIDFDTGTVALAGDVMLFTQSPDDAGESPIYSFKAGSSTVATSNGTYQNPYDLAVVTAFGEAIANPTIVGPAHDLYQAPAPLDALKSANQVSQLIPTPRSPVTAAAFSLTNGRIVYSADPAGAPRSSTLVTVLSRTLKTHPASVSISSPTPVAGQRDNGLSSALLVAASGTTTAYAFGGSGVNNGGFGERDAVGLRVISPHHKAIIRVSRFDAVNGTVAMSGDRVLYSATAIRYMVYNVKTGHSRVVRTGKLIDRVGLSGHYLAYANRYGAVFRKNLLTGKRVQLAPPRPSFSGPIAVYASGNWVGWEYGSTGGPSWLRNASTMAKSIRLAHSLYSLTSAGALLDTTQSAEFNRGPMGVSRTAIWLRSYSGHTRTLLSARAFVQGPQISGGVLAWISAAGALKVVRFMR